MAFDPLLGPHARRRPLGLALGAVLVAASAWWAYRGTRAPTGLGAGSRRLVRLLAAVAVLLALVWVGGVVVLWVIWPR